MPAVSPRRRHEAVFHTGLFHWGRIIRESKWCKGNTMPPLLTYGWCDLGAISLALTRHTIQVASTCLWHPYLREHSVNVNVTLWLRVSVAILSWFDFGLGGWVGGLVIERAIRGLIHQDNSLYIFLDRPLLLFSTQPSSKWKMPFIRPPQCSLCHYVGVWHFSLLRWNHSSLSDLAAMNSVELPSNIRTDY